MRLLVLLLAGCTLSHAPADAGARPRWHQDDAGAFTGATGRPDAQIAHRGNQGPSCGTPEPGCVATTEDPIIGAQPYCPADHDWIPAMASAWGIERHLAEARCSTWVVCDGLGVPCFHCLDSGPDWTEVGVDNETAEQRIARRIDEERALFGREPVAYANVLAEELDRLREEMRAEFSTQRHFHHTEHEDYVGLPVEPVDTTEGES